MISITFLIFIHRIVYSVIIFILWLKFYILFIVFRFFILFIQIMKYLFLWLWFLNKLRLDNSKWLIFAKSIVMLPDLVYWGFWCVLLTKSIEIALSTRSWYIVKSVHFYIYFNDPFQYDYLIALRGASPTSSMAPPCNGTLLRWVTYIVDVL